MICVYYFIGFLKLLVFYYFAALIARGKHLYLCVQVILALSIARLCAQY